MDTDTGEEGFTIGCWVENSSVSEMAMLRNLFKAIESRGADEREDEGDCHKSGGTSSSSECEDGGQVGAELGED